MDPIKYPSRIRYEYRGDAECPLHYVHGVWGGINPQGEIEVNFYVESDKLPAYSERTVEPDGALGMETVPFDDEERVVERHVRSRVLFNYHTARALLEWLEEKIETLEMEDRPFSPEDHGGVQQ